MIYVFYCISEHRLDAGSYKYLLNKIPIIFQNEIAKFRKWEDRQHRLFGKLLLLKGLEILGLKTYSLEQLKFTKLKRPYFDYSVDFNISHSGKYVVCAISTKAKIGIDIEEIKEIPLDDFSNEFSKKEMDEILNSQNSMRSFYEMWTKKEALLKAIGTGLHVALNKITIINNKVTWNKKEWFFTPVSIDENYSANTCADIFRCELTIEKLDFIR